MNRKFNYTNKYIPPHPGHLSLPWYERDGLMNCINALKSQVLKGVPQGHLQSTKMENFAVIHAHARGEKIDDII